MQDPGRGFRSGVMNLVKDLLANFFGWPLLNQFGWLVFTRILRFVLNPLSLLVIIAMIGLFWGLDSTGWIALGISFGAVAAIGWFFSSFSYSDAASRQVKRAFFASLWVRHLDTGSSGAEEVELAALENPIYGVQRIGVKFKPSPRHADLILMTGPLTRNLQRAALRTLYATPNATILRVGDAAIDGGVFKGSYALANRNDKYLSEIEDADFASGNPPSPQEMLERLASETRRRSIIRMPWQKPS
jgi:Ni,Fe-hydrogenase III small subunit